MRVERQPDGTYKLFNKKWKGPLFCGIGTDSCGDHWTWFPETPNWNNRGKPGLWVIKKESDGWYTITNKTFGGPLFCGSGTDGCGDHWAWVPKNPTDYDNNDKARWKFQQMEIPKGKMNDFFIHLR